MNTPSLITPELKRIRLAIFSLYFAQGLCFSSWASRIPSIKTALGLGDGAWGTILLMIPVGQICGMTLSGFLVSRVGSKNILPFALLAYVLSLLLIGMSSSEYTLIMSLIAFGFTANFCNISVNTQGVTIEAQYQKSIMASFHGGWSLAGFVGAAIGLLMININFSPFHHFIVVSIVIAFIYAANYKYLQADIKKVRNKTEGSKKQKPEKFLFLLGIIAFCGMAAEGAMADWSGLYFRDIVGVSDNLVPIGFASYMVTMATARFLVDGLTEKIGRKRVIQLSGTLIFVGLFMAVAYPSLIVTTLAFMIIGLGTSSIVPTVYSIAGHKTKMSTSVALTIVSSVSFLGFLLGPPIIGYVSAATNLRYSYGIIGLLGICIVAIAQSVKVLREE